VNGFPLKFFLSNGGTGGGDLLRIQFSIDFLGNTMIHKKLVVQSERINVPIVNDLVHLIVITIIRFQRLRFFGDPVDEFFTDHFAAVVIRSEFMVGIFQYQLLAFGIFRQSFLFGAVFRNTGKYIFLAVNKEAVIVEITIDK
jgi:hypothetical protein